MALEPPGHPIAEGSIALIDALRARTRTLTPVAETRGSPWHRRPEGGLAREAALSDVAGVQRLGRQGV
jgi:hypothetical protein